MRRAKILAALLLLLPCACKLGPNYKRPVLSVPDQYRGTAPPLSGQTPTPSAGQEAFGDTKWPGVFQDQALQSLITEALANNYNMRIAAARILEAGASLGITRANQLPTLGGVFGVENERSTPFYSGAPTIDAAGLQLNYIVDFWGQYRRATESARATLLATRYAQNVVRTTLVAQVANAYFQLRALDAQLSISQETLETDKDMVRINTIKQKGGESAITDVLQAQLLQQQTEAEIISLQQGIEQTENQISILLGRNPGPILRGLVLTEQPHLPEVPIGLPSDLLERRPDVLEAEQNLVAYNANVGVAKAAFFPQISLTGQFGAASTALTSFLQGPATFWAASGQIAQPIFEGGRISSAYRLAWAQRDEAELTYRQTVQNAFGDVSSSLVGYYRARQYRIKLEEQTATYKQAADLANVRFLGGYTAFLEVLVTRQQYFTSEIELNQAWFAELQNYVQLYQALGGGWQQ